jgi:hypothetical protein
MARRFRPFRTQTYATSKASSEIVYDTISDLRAHLEWSGERASSDTFKLLELDGPAGPATVGTSFTSSGAADNGTFHDRSVVTEASRPTRFTIETDSSLDRKRGERWEAHFSHRYDIEPQGAGSKIVYTEAVERVNYTPYWLHPLVRPIFRPLVDRADRKQLQNLARLAEERSAG